MKARAATFGALIVTAGRGVRILCQFAGLVIIARFLSPFDYGLVAMAGAFVGIASMLGDFGLSLSALRSAALDPVERGSLFWFSTGLGLVLALIAIGLGPALASYYHQPDIVLVVDALSPLFVINGAAAQYRVSSLRDGLYVATAVIDTVSAALGLIVGIAAAMAGAGYWTLIIQNWVVAVSGLVLIVMRCGWSPGWPRAGANLKGHLSFGGFATMTQVANYASSNTSSIALGRFLGPEVVGTYSRAYQLFALPVDQLTSPLTAIVLPLLAQVEPDRLPDVLRRMQRVLMYVVLGICLVIAAGGAPLTTIIMGDKWRQVGDLVQVLMVGAVFQLSGYVFYWAFLTTGRSDLLFWCEVPPRILMAGLVAFGAWYGEMGAAIGNSLGLAACWLIAGLFGARALGWRATPLLVGSVAPVLLYLYAFGVGVAVRTMAERSDATPLVSLALTLLAVGVAVLSGLLLPLYRRHARELIELGMMLLRRGPATQIRSL